MKKSFFNILALLMALISCQGDYDNGIDYPYYKFSETDKNSIINYDYEVGTVLTYKNQVNDILRFKVVEIKEGKTNQYSRGSFSGGGGYLEAYFERKIIRLEIIENGSGYTCCDQINYIFSKRENTFKFGFKFPLWNVPSSIIVDESQNPIDIQISSQNNFQYEVLEINNIVYDNVIKFQSDLTNSYNTSTNLDIFVNEIYYALDFGIIQFKDTNDMLWKLTDE